MLERLPAEITDLAVAAIARMSEMTINVEAAFDRTLDADRLARAADLVLDAEPVLGCRFVRDPDAPYWERLPPRRRADFAVADGRADFDRFLAEPLDAERGPQLRARLLRAPGGDRLRIQIGHLCADAGGTKHAVERFAALYTRLDDEPSYRPEPNVRGERGYRQVLRRVPWRLRPHIFARHLRGQYRIAGPGRPARIDLPDLPPRGSPRFVVRHLDREHVARLAAYGRDRGATLNDLLVTAYFRAVSVLAERRRPGFLRLFTTADLRRYLPGGRAGGVCNLSGFEFLGYRVPAHRDEPFDRLLALVSADMNERKRTGIGLCDYMTLMPSIRHFPFRWIDGIVERVIAAGTQAGKIPPALTNMGPIGKEQVRFDVPAREAWIVVPPGYPPYAITGVSGYDGTLTVSLGWYPESTPNAPLERLVEITLLELPA